MFEFSMSGVKITAPTPPGIDQRILKMHATSVACVFSVNQPVCLDREPSISISFYLSQTIKLCFFNDNCLHQRDCLWYPMPVYFLNIFVGKEVENFLCFFNEVKYYLCYKLYTFGLKIKRYYIYEYCLHITLCRKIIFKKCAFHLK